MKGNEKVIERLNALSWPNNTSVRLRSLTKA